MSDAPWENFKVGFPSSKENWTNTDCQPFSKVAHVTHMENALSIIRQGVIRPQLVYDESILNTQRILVNWTSPNDWYKGYRYGNVRFDFDWPSLIANKRYYWVEAMDYTPKACRILITDQNYEADPNLVLYDPTAGDGPWWWKQDEDIHYRNGEYCLEVMLEFELTISDSRTIDFVKHHPSFCCVNPSSCAERGSTAQKAAARFIAGAISIDLDCKNLPFDEQDVYGASADLYQKLRKQDYAGEIDDDHESAEALARSIARCHYQRNDQELAALARLFKNAKSAYEPLDRLIERSFPTILLD